MSANLAPPITLLTDFGMQDTYVAEMHGVIAGLAPNVRVIDLTHAILPQNIRQGALALADAVEAFPDGTIHVAVVDPGVGSRRRAVAAEIGRWRFVGPDNGLLSGVLRRWPRQRVVSLTNPQFFRAAVSRTFHGRDIFAPVAAHWAAGVALEAFGNPLETPLIQLDWPSPTRGDHCLTGQVLAIDHFGNLLTDLTVDLLSTQVPSGAASVTVLVGEQCVGPIVGAYSERPGQLLALVGSHGRLEIAVESGSAAKQLQLGVGATVVVQWSHS